MTITLVLGSVAVVVVMPFCKALGVLTSSVGLSVQGSGQTLNPKPRCPLFCTQPCNAGSFLLSGKKKPHTIFQP